MRPPASNRLIGTVILLVQVVSADNCGDGAINNGGNWYCQATTAIKYSNVGNAGSYNQITAMNSDGTCSFVPKAFSGPISPLDEEVSSLSIALQQSQQLILYERYLSTSEDPCILKSSQRIASSLLRET
jgi:hypothetical protein